MVFVCPEICSEICLVVCPTVKKIKKSHGRTHLLEVGMTKIPGRP